MQDTNTENNTPTQPMSGTEETLPMPVAQDPIDPVDPMELTPIDQPLAEPPWPADPAPTQKAPRKRRWPWVLLGIFLIFLFGGGGTWLGYQSAVQLRKAKLDGQRINIATEHFMLGLTAQQNKQYQIAQQQFEYVIRLDPSFPGAQDKLREVMIAMAIKATPTPVPTVPTPTLTPTKDLRPLEEIFNQAKQQLVNKEWDAVFATIDTLRQADPTYRAVEVDGMLYTALRYRGVDKLLHTANLEGGLYDLALAERFGPLDVDAKGYRNWARMYLNGSSFWEIDWLKVMSYFEEIYPAFPNMRDSSGLTAVERYRIAAREYANQLVARDDLCGAKEYYEKSLGAVPDGQLAQTATQVAIDCEPPADTPEPPKEMTATPEPPQATQPATATPTQVEPPAEATTTTVAEPTGE